MKKLVLSLLASAFAGAAFSSNVERRPIKVQPLPKKPAKAEALRDFPKVNVLLAEGRNAIGLVADLPYGFVAAGDGKVAIILNICAAYDAVRPNVPLDVSAFFKGLDLESLDSISISQGDAIVVIDFVNNVTKPNAEALAGKDGEFKGLVQFSDEVWKSFLEQIKVAALVARLDALPGHGL